MTEIEKIKELTDEFFESIGCKTIDLPKVKYQVKVVETLRKVVEVELPVGSASDAKDLVRKMYENELVVLSADDHCDTEFNLVDNDD